VHVGRGDAPGRERGVIPAEGGAGTYRVGETSYEEVLKLLARGRGAGAPPAGETRALVYRGQKVVPHRRRSFGWFATVGHWDVEDHRSPDRLRARPSCAIFRLASPGHG